MLTLANKHGCSINEFPIVFQQSKIPRFINTKQCCSKNYEKCNKDTVEIYSADFVQMLRACGTDKTKYK